MGSRRGGLLTIAGAGVLVGSLVIGGVSLVGAAPGPSDSQIEIRDDVGTALNVTVDSLPAVGGSVTVANTVPVTGTVAVSNFPATQPVSGSVTVANTSPIPVTQSAPDTFIASAPWVIANGDATRGTREFSTGSSALVVDRINARCSYLYYVVFGFYSGGVLRTMVFEPYRANFNDDAHFVLDIDLGDVVADANSNISILAVADPTYGNCDSGPIVGLTVTGHRR